MPPRILPILERLRQDQSEQLAPAAIEDACRHEGYTWRRRLLDPVTTVYLFLLQVLHGNTACQHVVQFGGRTFSDSAYCQARKRLPLRVLHRLLEWITRAGRRATASGHRWFGHRVWVMDGSGRGKGAAKGGKGDIANSPGNLDNLGGQCPAPR